MSDICWFSAAAPFLSALLLVTALLLRLLNSIQNFLWLLLCYFVFCWFCSRSSVHLSLFSTNTRPPFNLRHFYFVWLVYGISNILTCLWFSVGRGPLLPLSSRHLTSLPLFPCDPWTFSPRLCGSLSASSGIQGLGAIAAASGDGDATVTSISHQFVFYWF